MVVLLPTGSTAEPLSSAYASPFGGAFAAAPLGSVLGSAAAAAAGKQVEGKRTLILISLTLVIFDVISY